MTRNSHEILISLSLSNLLFIAGWRDLLYPSTFDYHIQTPASPIHFTSVILCVLLTAAAIAGGLWLARRFFGAKAKPLVGLVFLLTIFAALNVFRVQFSSPETPYYIGVIFLTLLISALLIALTKWRDYVFDTGKVFVLILSPFILVTFSQSVLKIIDSGAAAEAQPPVSAQLEKLEARPKEKIKNRVVWIIFDEFDYRAAFESGAVELPEFTRLKKESLTATNAASPAYETLEAIPALLTGKRVEKAEPTGKSELVLNLADNSSVEFSSAPNVFSEIKSLGGDSAVVGWYHPYCRVVGDSLSVCRWEGENYSKDNSLPAAMLSNFRDLIEDLPSIFAVSPQFQPKGFAKSINFQFRADEAETRKTAEKHFQRLEELKRIASNPQIDLAFFHLPFPHAPVQFDAAAGRFSDERQDYVNNLILTDRVLGEIRRSMEEANLWENSTVIISSDHQWRINKWKTADRAHKLSLTDGDRRLTGETEDARVPFFLKLKNHKESVVFEKPFNTIVTRDLIAALLKGELATPDEAKIKLETAADR